MLLDRRSAARLDVVPVLSGLLVAGSSAAWSQSLTANPTMPIAAGTVSAAAQMTPVSAPPITFSALLDGYYAYNFNKPSISGAPGTNGPTFDSRPRNYDFADNSFSFGMAEVGLNRAVSDASRLGFTVKVIYGPTATLVNSAPSASLDASTLNLLQAYGTYLIPLKGKDLTVDAGKFVTHMGYEVIEPELNWNYSRSDLFAAFIPHYGAGIRAALPFGPAFTATGYIYNGWNSAAADDNLSKAYGFALAFTPSPKWSLSFNGLTSSEPDANYTPEFGVGEPADLVVPNRAVNVLEPILTYNFSRALSAVVDANFDFGNGPSPGDSTDIDGNWNASGVAGYLHYVMKSGSSLTLRGETFDDNKGYLTGNNGEKGSEITLTYGIRSPLFAGAETRLEYRYDSLKDAAGDNLFFGANGAMNKKSQNTISVSENLSF